MTIFYLGSSGDDTVPGLSYWDPNSGGGVGSFNGFAGYDTLDYSAVTTGWIWFAPGYSYVQDPTKPLIYFPEIDDELHLWSTVINFEHVLAGSGNDIMYMHSTPHAPYDGPLSTWPLWMHLDAGAGDDTFLFYSSGFDDGDIYDGGTGEDIMDLSPESNASHGFEVNLFLGTMVDHSGAEATLMNIEAVFGGAGNDVMTPGFGTTVMNGNGGDDVFKLSKGVITSGQTMNGGDGTDTLSFLGEAHDVHVDLSISYAEVDDFFDPWLFVFDFEVVVGGAGDDTVTGTDGHNRISGNRGDDHIDGGRGRDTLLGGADNDVLIGGIGADTLFGNDGRDRLNGGSQADKLFGGGGIDTLRGGNGNDILRGGSHRDTLRGGNGDDLLEGGWGNDTLFGGAGNDRFVFSRSHDTIEDFTQGQDRIDFTHGASQLIAADLAALGAYVVDTNAPDLVLQNGAHMLTVIGLSWQDASAADFIFS